MTSPITATVSHAAAQATQPAQSTNSVRNDAANGQVSPQQMARLSSIAAERRGAQLHDEQRVMKRGEKRTEASFAPQKTPRRDERASAQAVEPEREEATPKDLGQHVDVEV